MRLHALVALLFSAVALTAGTHAQHHHHRGHRRQAELAAVATTSTHSGSSSSSPSSPPASTPTLSSSTTSSPGSISTGSSSSSTNSSPSSPASVPTGQNGVPPLSMISSGMPTGTSSPLASTYTPGATPPVPGAPPLPTAFVFNAADWPAQDKVPDTNSPQVQQWIQELEGFDIPDWSPTADGTCVGDPAAAAEGKTRGWWTCGGTTRDTDITACPKKYDWGVSFDDGPSPWSGTLLNYLSKQAIKATFFVVGSRVIERPAVLIEEYMAGHEISVHTWSHRPLTSLTNEQIVAELGWTRMAIQKVLGVTPTTMRPPYGDIDDRVRAIALAMGMVPIIWTSAPSSGPFDTNDWRVAGGLVNATTSFDTFQSILGNASTLSTGFIVLQHDLYEITVDLAVGYTLNAALTHNPPFSLKPIGTCSNIPATNMYSESNQNTTFPYTNHTVITSKNSNSSSSAAQSSSNTANGRVSVSWLVAGLVGVGCAVVHLMN
ncbi:carbohydrate esterase family 4 protein [Lactarius akahatsu]|uniref:chitin deacetylase n=1 Tax=Lactarius akahatsu TaxID=416441 RepID=A0AAD4QHH5_9AGAM|nr:carbohydrate esterase family 4 protein [Lactarius akahatsu]